jgi:hypothetical protein
MRLKWPARSDHPGALWSLCPSRVDCPETATQEIMSQADHLVKHFEDHEPHSAKVRDAASLRKVRKAFLQKAVSEEELLMSVLDARSDGQSWGAIGAMLGTSGEAARQRYGSQASKR